MIRDKGLDGTNLTEEQVRWAEGMQRKLKQTNPVHAVSRGWARTEATLVMVRRPVLERALAIHPDTIRAQNNLEAVR